jgi:DNA-binding helix-hairpin-helix protein with protein kinase domain
MWLHADTSRRPLQLGKSFPRGAEGIVSLIAGDGASVAKIYHREQDSQIAQLETRAQKLVAMIDNPPRTRTTRTQNGPVLLLAWPTEIIDGDDGSFSGFTMPLVSQDKTVSVSLFKYLSELTHRVELSEKELCLPSRITLCRSLAGIVADLHAQNFYVVDFKPVNIRVYRGSCIPCFLDTDSFSIEAKGGKRFLASAITPDYTCPELLTGSTQEAPGLHQDLFALAVMLFEILNHNIHPFIGKRRNLAPNEDDQLTDRIRLGLYAYGLNPHPHIEPVAGSDHDLLPTSTRKLFDQALTGGPGNRPAARQWKEHFDHFLHTKGQFAKCKEHPGEMMHIHFAGSDCAECRRAPMLPARVARPHEAEAVPPPQAAAAAPARRRLRKFIIGVLITGAVLLVLYIANNP